MSFQCHLAASLILTPRLHVLKYRCQSGEVVICVSVSDATAKH